MYVIYIHRYVELPADTQTPLCNTNIIFVYPTHFIIVKIIPHICIYHYPIIHLIDPIVHLIDQ